MVVRRLLAALVLLPVLVACSDKETGGPRADPSEPTSSATVEPTPTEPTSPAMPSAVRRLNDDGAAAFVDYYWQVVEYAELTGDVASLGRLGSVACTKCRGGIGYVTKVHRQGGQILGDPRVVTVIGVNHFRDGPVRFALVDARLQTPPSREFYGPGDKRNRRWPGATVRYQFALRASDGKQWRLDTWEVESG